MRTSKNARLLLASTAVAVLAVTVAACGGDDDGDGGGGGGTDTVSLLMNWFPQAEHGGYYDAQENELGADEGVQIQVEPGGPQIQTIAQVAAGEADYGVAQADELILARAEGVPVTEVFAAFDTFPQCMMFQPAAGIESFEDLEGHQVAIAPSGGFWPWIRGEFDLQDVQEVNFTGTLSELKRNDDLAQQCFITSEPYFADQENIPHEELLVADAGYNPYANGIFTTDQKIQEDPEEVAAVVAAVQQGWENFVSDPEAAKQAILDANKDMEAELVDFAHGIISDRLVGDEIGAMNEERWSTLADQLR
ncbi:MAG: ABC transporter substrate-binding protein, partial [Actinomycetota bacterium]